MRVVLQPSGLWEGDTEWEDEINRPEYSGEDRLAYVVAGRHGEHLRRQDARKDTVDHFMVYATLPPMAVKKDSDEDLVLRATAPAGQHRRALVEAAVACVHEVLLLHRTTWSDVADAIEKHETLEWGQLQPLVRSIVA